MTTMGGSGFMGPNEETPLRRQGEGGLACAASGHWLTCVQVEMSCVTLWTPSPVQTRNFAPAPPVCPLMRIRLSEELAVSIWLDAVAVSTLPDVRCALNSTAP